jgi:tRNA threonylcarbamoyl adenosine modification protein (Sua5/YciO/YrdC/YwlC family)
VLLRFYGQSINEKHIAQIVDVLKHDGVIVIPTDTVYALAGSVYSNKAVERISRIKNTRIEKAHFSFLCHDLSKISEFTTPFNTEVFRLMKNSLPGPFTFILNANTNVPTIFKSNKKTIGIRVPDNAIALSILEALGNPLMVTSIHGNDEADEYITDPEEIHEQLEGKVDLVVDGGAFRYEPSTVIDCTSGSPVVVREGKGEI